MEEKGGNDPNMRTVSQFLSSWFGNSSFSCNADPRICCEGSMRDRRFKAHCAALFCVFEYMCRVCDVLVQFASHPQPPYWHKRAINIVALALFLLATVKMDDTKPVDETCATFATPRYRRLQASQYKHMNEFWKKRCGFKNRLLRTYSSTPRFATSTALIGGGNLRMNLQEGCSTRSISMDGRKSS